MYKEEKGQKNVMVFVNAGVLLRIMQDWTHASDLFEGTPYFRPKEPPFNFRGNIEHSLAMAVGNPT